MASNTPTPLSNITILRAIRDAQSTRNGDRALLEALAHRCAPDKGYMCWPSYALLAEDTGLGLTTLRNAARSLEKAGLIRRKVRRDRSNLWFVNVPLLIDQVAERVAAKKAAQAAEEEYPFGDLPATMGDEEPGYCFSVNPEGATQ